MGQLHPHTGTTQRISRFYVVNAGSISDEARELFFSLLTQTYGDNARLLDGNAMLHLDRTAVARSETTRDTLAGLLLEVRSNRAVLSEIAGPLSAILKSDGHSVAYPTERLRTVAFSAVLARPSSLAGNAFDLVASIYDRAVAVNRAMDEPGGALQTVVTIKIPAANPSLPT